MYRNGLYHDAAGNRTRLEYNDGSTTTTTYLYNPADQLTRETVGGTNTDYLYDANGSLTKKDDGTNVHSYSYDYRNLMTDYDGPGTSNDATYTYNAGGCRITKDVNGTKTAYFHDGLNVVAEYNGSNQLQRTYVTPGLDQNLTMTASGSTYYYLKDALGSVRQLIDSNEATQNSYDYFAFGKVYGIPTENVTQPFRFTGRAWDPETELYYYRARNYAAQVGLFLARDALLSLPPYGYVLNAPTLFVDPLGLRSLRDWLRDRLSAGLAGAGGFGASLSDQGESMVESAQRMTGAASGSQKLMNWWYGVDAPYPYMPLDEWYGKSFLGQAETLGPGTYSATKGVLYGGAALELGVVAWWTAPAWLPYVASAYAAGHDSLTAAYVAAQNFVMQHPGVGEALWGALEGALPGPPPDARSGWHAVGIGAGQLADDAYYALPAVYESLKEFGRGLFGGSKPSVSEGLKEFGGGSFGGSAPCN